VPEGVEATANNGNLTLTGAVKFPSQRAAAESAVSRLIGVRNIKDEIGFVFDVDPEDVTRLVKEALDHHAVPLDDSHVVASTSGNTVTLQVAFGAGGHVAVDDLLGGAPAQGAGDPAAQARPRCCGPCCSRSAASRSGRAPGRRPDGTLVLTKRAGEG
jgi:hypothetical protein